MPGRELHAKLIETAVDYVGRGLPVFPCNGKRPYTEHGFHDASTDQATVLAWWSRWPVAAIGIPTGEASGIDVLDVDVQHGGAGTLKALEHKHGELPATVQVLTPSGGYHYWFRHVRAFKTGAADLGPGLDTRGEGGYVIVPPSLGENGRAYRFMRSAKKVEPAEPPGWLVEQLDTGKRQNGGAAKVAEIIPGGTRHATLLSLAGTMRRRGMSASEILAALRETNRLRCKPRLDDDELRALAADVEQRYEPVRPLPNCLETGANYAKTDLGNAEAFVDLHSQELRFVPAERAWLVWDGQRWRRDLTGEPKRAAKFTARELLRRSADIDDEKAREAAAKWALASQSRGRVEALLELASTEPELALAPDDLDRDPWVLSCGNGTLDLRSGDLRGPSREDLITRGTDVVYDPQASCARWLQFLVEVFDGDGELVEYVRRAIGYSLTGDAREHVLFVLHGAGRNGKTTLIETAKRLLGDAARQTPFDTFARSRKGEARNDIAALHRTRLAVASESGENRRLDEATIKVVTGGDTISARFLYKEFFEYQPRFKVWLVTNNRPRVSGDDDAIWARLRLIPFAVSFVGREDQALMGRLEEELPGILAWAVQGCLAWQEDGLGSAAAVERATSEYREEEDVLGAFLSERCRLEGEATPAELREAYEAFCRDAGEKPSGASLLGRQLSRRGIKRYGRGRQVYRGVSLR